MGLARGGWGWGWDGFGVGLGTGLLVAGATLPYYVGYSATAIRRMAVATAILHMPTARLMATDIVGLSWRPIIRAIGTPVTWIRRLSVSSIPTGCRV